MLAQTPNPGGMASYTPGDWQVFFAALGVLIIIVGLVAVAIIVAVRAKSTADTTKFVLGLLSARQDAHEQTVTGLAKSMPPTPAPLPIAKQMEQGHQQAE